MKTNKIPFKGLTNDEKIAIINDPKYRNEFFYTVLKSCNEAIDRHSAQKE